MMGGKILQASVRLALTAKLPVLSVGDGIEALLGFKPEDFLSSRVSLKERIHPDDSDIADALFSPEIQRGAGGFNIRMRHADGRLRCIKGHCAKQAGPGGGPPVLDLLLQDAATLIEDAGEFPMMANFRAMMESFEDLIYFKDRNHVFTAVNQAAIPIKEGYMRDVVGKTDYDLWREESADEIYRMEEQIFAGLPMAQRIHELELAPGKKSWVDNRVYPIKALGGEIIGVWGMARDITRRVEAEQALRESEELLRESQTIAGLGSYVMDIRTGAWRSSEILDRLFGIDQGYEHTLEGWLSLIHPEDRAMMDSYFRDEVVGRGRAFDKEYRIVRQTDQAVRWVHGLGRLEFDAQGQPVKMRGTIHDITERKQAEEALRENKELLQLFIEHAPVGLAMFDREMRFLAVNHHWLENSFLVGREVIGHSAYEIFPTLPERLKETHRRGLAGEAMQAGEDYRERPNGRVQWIRWEIHPWMTGDGNVGGIVHFSEDITERKQAEEALRESKELLQLFIEHSPAALAMFDREMRFLIANRRYLEIFSLVEREIIGHPLYEIFPDLPESLKETHRRALAGEAMQNGEGSIPMPDGSAHWALWGLRPWLTGNGDVGGIVLSIEDVTERKQAEEALRESKELLQLFIEHSPAGLAMFDREMRFLVANRHYLEASFLVGREVIGHSGYEIFPDLSESLKETHRRALAGEAMQAGEDRRELPDGSVHWSRWRVHPWLTGNGDVGGTVLFIEDITERKQAEEALRESNKLLQLFIEHAPVALAMFDREMRILAVSRHYLEISFLVGREVIGHSAYEIFPTLPESLKETHRRALAGEAMQAGEDRINRPDGSVQWIQWGIHPWLTGNGDVGGIVLFTENITERKQAEAALRESEERLQLFIEHAPAALAMFDREMRYLAVSRRWMDAHGLGDREIIGHSHYEIFPDLPESWKEAHCRGLAGEALRFDKDRLIKPDGNIAWIRREIHPWLTGDGAVGGILLFSEDVTERMQAEERLRLASSVFTYAHEGILITAPDGAILDVNDTFTQITGYTREEVLGRNPRLLNSGRHDKEFYAAMWRALLEKGYWSGEIWNRSKDGRIYAETLTISAVRNESGEVQQYVALFSDITTIKEHEQQLRHIAHYDVLTSLPNRVLLADRLNLAMAQFPRLNRTMTQSRRRGQLMAVAYLDLDGFKAINDSHGHDVGDQLLAVVASRMKKVLRKGDTLARLGGDEFVALLLDLENPEASIPMLNRMLKAASQPVQIGDHDLQVSVSIGVTFYPQEEEAAADQLLRQADQAMYQAKLAGKNRYHLFDFNQDRTVRGRLAGLDRIRQALAAGEFVLYYQPIVNMRKGTVEGAEALIRWQHPEQGLMLPGNFLPVIEDHPLAIELGEWVIDTALTQMERWQAAGLVMPVSVNVGARQLQESDFVDRLAKLLAAHPHVKPTNLELEILETSAVLDMAHVSEMLEECREMGVSFSLDDFGTGYSSLSYLKHLPADILKIDRSFVRDILDDPEDLTILEGVLGLATAFRRGFIAEGVETADHGLMLLRLGCEMAQGFGIAHPMPADDLPGWAAAWQPDPRWIDVMPASQDERQFLHAAVEHRCWIAEIEAFLKNERHVPPQLNIEHCRFGALIAAKSMAARRESPEFQRLDDLHRQIHALAVDIVNFRDRDRNPEPLARLDELHHLNAALLNQLELCKGG
jgi:diguanylate cyclase (GGDEF)-like protein/PAS domain S-box-containing protein